MTRKNKSTRARNSKNAENIRNEENSLFKQNNPSLENSYKKSKKSVIIEPRSENQQRFMDALEDPEKDIIFGTGPAGSGKTMLATLYAIRSLREGIISKIIITRPTVSVDEKLGFLPGDLGEKMSPWLLPITDVFEMYYTPMEVAKMMEHNIIHIAPLGFMRGRTFKDAVVLADEMQNCTPDQMKMLLTRIGEGSKLIITGDIQQHDRGYSSNGLKDFLERNNKRPSPHIDVIEFNNSDIQRHPIIEHILDLY